MALNKGYLTAKTTAASDEYYTPANVVESLLPFVKESGYHDIWCPFDTEDSEFVSVLRKEGYHVINTHIDMGQNFFFYEPEEHYDVIISNPPFSIKDTILKRLSELKKPFAMLLPLPTLQGQTRFPYLQDTQALVFDKRINYWQDYSHTIMAKGVAFASIFICKDFLKKDLVFTKLLS